MKKSVLLANRSAFYIVYCSLLCIYILFFYSLNHLIISLSNQTQAEATHTVRSITNELKMIHWWIWICKMCKCKFDRFSLISWITRNWLHYVGFGGDESNNLIKEGTERHSTVIFRKIQNVNFEHFASKAQNQWLDKSFSTNECIHRLSTFELEMRFSVRVSNTYTHEIRSISHTFFAITNSYDKRTHIANYMQFISEMIMRNNFGVFCTMCGFHRCTYAFRTYVWMLVFRCVYVSGAKDFHR